MLLFRTKSQRASRSSLDTTTITTYDSSGSGENGLISSTSGLGRTYDLKTRGSAFTNGFERPHSPVTRQETLDHPGVRGNGRMTMEGFREASEITVMQLLFMLVQIKEIKRAAATCTEVVLMNI
ncbi:hypothetical protein CEXT_363201 [Caerostris extrusa]|uniref:Uncharacterized protein n=1 Tax=Caerostris extrusa TaxID=172846 RepID=A0AAV4PGD7_CAEEX|nr:hypothetical protein CEXT_363201 [Caerostris extrusa]